MKTGTTFLNMKTWKKFPKTKRKHEAGLIFPRFPMTQQVRLDRSNRQKEKRVSGYNRSKNV
jgi:hypothetical protein